MFDSGQSFALLSGTSMATPHVAGIASLIKQRHRSWSPAAIASAIMTTANVTDQWGAALLAHQFKDKLSPATPFDLGAGLINPSRAIDPGLVFDASFKHYVEFLCAVPGVDEMSVRRAVGVGCPEKRMEWCSDLNAASVTVSNLVGSRNVTRKVTNVGDYDEKYRVSVKEPFGVRISVSPMAFKISVNASRYITLIMEATRRTNSYTFGEMVMEGNKNHVVRVPISVFVSSLLK